MRIARLEKGTVVYALGKSTKDASADAFTVPFTLCDLDPFLKLVRVANRLDGSEHLLKLDAFKKFFRSEPAELFNGPMRVFVVAD